MCLMEHWVKQQCQIQYYTIPLAATITQVIPADPMRFSITLPTNTANAWSFGFFASTPAAPMWQMPTNTTWLTLSDADISDLIQLPLWAKFVTATFTIVIATMSYNPGRKAAYDEWVRSKLPGSAAP